MTRPSTVPCVGSGASPAGNALRPMPLGALRSGVAVAALLGGSAAGCGAAGARGDDLGYDPAVADLGAPVEPLFDARGLPLGSAGVPLRAEAVTGEWTTFRGDRTRSGTRLAPGIGDPRIRWSTRVGIQGYTNTPLVGRDAVFVSSQGATHDVGDSEDGFYALDLADGSRRWFFGTNEDVNGASLSDELVIGGTDDGTLYAIERATGRERWRVELGSPQRHGPLIDGDLAYAQLVDGVAVIDVHTGSTREILPGASDDSGRGALAATRRALFRTARNCRLESWEGGDDAWSATVCPIGSEEWVWADNYVPPMPIGGALLTIAPSLLDYSSAELHVELRDATTGERFWTSETEQLVSDMGMVPAEPGYDLPYHASLPWLMNGTLFVPQVTLPNVVGIDLASGRMRAVLRMPDCRSRQFASIVGVPARGYFARHDGTLYGFAPATGSISWSLNLQYQASAGSSPRVGYGYDPYLYSDTYCYADPWDGTALFATPAIGEDGVLYVGSGEGFLYAIGDSDWR